MNVIKFLAVAVYSLHVCATCADAGQLSSEQLNWYRARLDDQSHSVFSTTTAVAANAPHPDSLAESLLLWNRLKNEDYNPNFAELSRFLINNPGWPQEKSLRIKAEQAIISSVDRPQDIIKFFGAFPVITATGRVRLAEALTQTGQPQAGASLIREAWASGGLSLPDETLVISTYATSLTHADHIRRADQLLWQDQATAARRVLPYLDPDYRLLAEARLALKLRSNDVDAKIAAVPKSLQNTSGLIYDRARWLLRTRSDDTAATAFLLASAVDSQEGIKASAWVKLRQTLARSAVDRGAYEDGYHLLADHHLAGNIATISDDNETDRVAYVETEWRAGWIALRYLRKPADAIKHFQAMQAVAQSPITLSRAAYWAGRSAEALNNGALAQQWYGRAAQFPDFFYGQLAVEKLGRPILPPDLTPPVVSAEAMQAYQARNIVQAARLLGQLGEPELQTQFINTIAARADTPEEKRVAADLAVEIKRPDLGVRIGKLARNKGMSLAYAAYPRLTLPEGLSNIWSMAHAITRQESVFNASARSRAGARGLMQLMPGTARGVSAKLGLPYALDKLTSDPVYNMTLGATYIQDRLDSYGGNAVLAVASYNAGPGNVSKWLNRNGDPRSPNVDVIDWIEQIPFTETRDYVMRVLENAVVYSLIEPGRSKVNGYGLLSGYLGRTPNTNRVDK